MQTAEEERGKESWCISWRIVVQTVEEEWGERRVGGGGKIIFSPQDRASNYNACCVAVWALYCTLVKNSVEHLPG